MRTARQNSTDDITLSELSVFSTGQYGTWDFSPEYDFSPT